MEDSQTVIQQPIIQQIVPPELTQDHLTPKKRTLPANFRKPVGTLAKKTKKALDLVSRTGVSPKEALTLVHNGKTPCYQSLTNFKRNLDKYRLAHPMMDKLARNAVKAVLKDGEVNGEKASVSAVLAAASMVKDRTEPIVRQNINLNLNADLSPVDLEKWRNR